MTKKTILKLMCIPVGLLLIRKTGQKYFKDNIKKNIIEEEIKEQIRNNITEYNTDFKELSNDLSVLYKIDKSPKEINKWLKSSYSDFELAVSLMLYFNISCEDIDQNVFILNMCNSIEGRDC